MKMKKEEYLVGAFKKKMGNYYMDFAIHEGFESKEDAFEHLKSKDVDKEHTVLIKFLDMYYVVIFEDYNREIIIGKWQTFYLNYL